MRSLCLLPGGLREFVTCCIGAYHCRLRHIGWEKCGHGLTFRLRESVSFFPIRNCSAQFSCLTPSWPLRFHFSVDNLVVVYSDAGRRAAFNEVDGDVSWVSGSGSG